MTYFLVHLSSHIMLSWPEETETLHDMIVCKPSHQVTVMVTRKINTRLHSTVVVDCFDCSSLPLLS